MPTKMQPWHSQFGSMRNWAILKHKARDCCVIITDVGDVSWVVPTTGLRTATWVPGTSAHSWQAIAAGGTSIGAKGMQVAAKTLALTVMDLMTEEGLIAKAVVEFEDRRGEDFEYEALLGDREPPLAYRLR